ncbi:MAG: tRNA pseudouridine(38-40) synthase TruA [Erysipelotrichaceae bacterium]|jgi:tRNA pseudouridine38-40 synthase|nr:tRNA pseudouridine(38-40) synthase TruA [Erysipelotrichaceae bacterium]
MKIFGTCAYKGTNYYGWQKQVNHISVQGTIEEALSQIYNTKITIIGSGRTDAGTHAIKQCFHYETDKEKDLEQLAYALNKILPEDIKIHGLSLVDDCFHARYSAKRKVYEYQIALTNKDPFIFDAAYIYPYEFNLLVFKEALMLFLGEHNFQDFTSKEIDEDNFVRTIYDIKIEQNDNIIKVTFEGNGFMRYQIRNMVGTALVIASNKERIDFIVSHLDSNKIRSIVAYKAPANGLYLVDVRY